MGASTYANSDLKCFVRIAGNGKPYRACLPKKKKPPKRHQDERGNPHGSGRVQPRQLAYQPGEKKANAKAKTKGAIKAKNIDKLVGTSKAKNPLATEKRKKIVLKYAKLKEGKSREEKIKLTKEMNKKLQELKSPPKKKKLKIVGRHPMPDGSMMTGKVHSKDSKPIKKKRKLIIKKPVVKKTMTIYPKKKK